MTGQGRPPGAGEWPYPDSVPWHDWSGWYRLPVVAHPYPRCGYHVAVAIPGALTRDSAGGNHSWDVDAWQMVMPGDDEAAVLGSYARFGIERYYRRGWIEKMAQDPVDVDASVNTRTFLKRADGWRYRVATWELHGPWPYDADTQPTFPPTVAGLIGLLDWIERDYEDTAAVHPAWAAWKGRHPGMFSTPGVRVEPVPGVSA